MTRSTYYDNESEDYAFKQMTDLLKETVKRRITLLLDDVAVNLTEVNTSWNIKTEKQLTHWANIKLTNFLFVLNELRHERDATLSCLKRWKELKNKLCYVV